MKRAWLFYSSFILVNLGVHAYFTGYNGYKIFRYGNFFQVLLKTSFIFILLYLLVMHVCTELNVEEVDAYLQ